MRSISIAEFDYVKYQQIKGSLLCGYPAYAQ